MYLDTGLSQEEAQRRIPVGTPAVYRTGCRTLGDKLLCGKALDDRACFAVLLDAAEQLKDAELDVDLYLLGSTQEETHSTGAITAAYGLAPDFCVAVDVTHGDSPDASKEKTFPLGKGPVIGLGPNCTKWMAKRMEQKAQELDLPVQYEVMAAPRAPTAGPCRSSGRALPRRCCPSPCGICTPPLRPSTRTTWPTPQSCCRLCAWAWRGGGGPVIETLKTLCALNGVSGDEDAVRDYLRTQAEPYADSIRTDALGNLIVFKRGRKATGSKLLLCAHMDEVGLIVTRATEDGFLKFDFVAAWTAGWCWASRWSWVRTGSPALWA